MTGTETRESAGIVVDPRHAARLKAMEQQHGPRKHKTPRIKYVCEVLHQQDPESVTTANVLAWLTAYGLPPKLPDGKPNPVSSSRTRVSEVVGPFREERGLSATSGDKTSGPARLPVMTPQLQAAFAELRETGRVIPIRPDTSTGHPDTTPR